LTTATKTTKPNKKRTDQPAAEAPAEPVGSGSSTATSETAAPPLSDLLAEFGFTESEAWTDSELLDVIDTLEKWGNESAEARHGRGVSPTIRTPVPEILKAFEQVQPESALAAKADGAKAATLGQTENDNPMPPGTALGEVWLLAFREAKATATETAATKEAARKADQEEQRRIAIEAAQHELEEASLHVAELEDQIVDLKGEMGELTASLKNARSRNSKASRMLARARGGIFERTMPFPSDKPTTLDVPDQDIGGPPVPLPEDHGAAKDLNCLRKGTVQKETGCRDDIGLGQAIIEKLKEACGGTTIGALEKWQRENPDWNRTKGFGEERVTQLQDAHMAVRQKWPIPTIEQAIVDHAAKAFNDGAMSGATAETTNVTMTHTQAVRRLQDLVARAGDVADDCESDAGVAFCESVAEQAGKVCGTILESNTVTPKQIEAITNWEAAVEGWARGGDDVDDLEEDLD
jgi:hypothetical protein